MGRQLHTFLRVREGEESSGKGRRAWWQMRWDVLDSQLSRHRSGHLLWLFTSSHLPLDL